MNNKSFHDRLSLSERLLKKYPDKVPVIIDISKTYNLELKIKKYIVSKDDTLAQFIMKLRENMKIKPEQGIFLFINKKLVPVSMKMEIIYNSMKSDDGLLYIMVCTENAFGTSSY
jgi:hypothetical protein